MNQSLIPGYITDTAIDILGVTASIAVVFLTIGLLIVGIVTLIEIIRE